MFNRKRTKPQERSYVELLEELGKIECWNTERKWKEGIIPADWKRLDKTAPVKPKKTRITAGFDADVVRWYRRLGEGYQARMNGVLRAYMLAVISKEIERLGDRDWYGDPI